MSKLQSAALALLLSVGAAAHAYTVYLPGCEAGKTTLEIAECRQKQIDAADAKLGQYLTAARKRVVAFDVQVGLIDEEQKAWEAYRSAHCGNVYELWRQGTIRYEMSAICTLEVTRERTVDVWRAYLTYGDSTPPTLPDPSK